MNAYFFKSWSEANIFAKKMASSNQRVRLAADGSQWLVEVDNQQQSQQLPDSKTEKAHAQKKPLNETRPKLQKPLTPTEVKTVKHKQSQAIHSGQLCSGCGKSIPKARLDANPGVLFCVECQSKREGDYHRYIAEPTGTRKDFKRMRGQVWSDMRNRSR